MARAPKATPRGHDTDYTITGLVVIVAVVILTGLFFGQPQGAGPAGNLGGQAIAPSSMQTDALAPDSCETASFCDGSRLIRQGPDCSQYEAFCVYGCSLTNGQAQCNS